VATEINEMTELAHEGAGIALTTTPVVGTPSRKYADVLAPGTEPLAADEIRVTILGSGDPFVKKSQASASLLIEVGNAEGDFFYFDLGSGALANFDGLGMPVTSTTKVLLSHLHADHVGDMPTLMWSLAKSGRRDAVEVWGPAGEHEHLGTRAYTRHLDLAHAWDTKSMCGNPGQSGARALTTEVPYDRPEVVYQRNGATITSFPVIHIHNGAVGYRLDYACRSVVFSGDTRPCRYLVEACDDADLLIPETFPSPSIFARKAGVPVGPGRGVRQRGPHQPRHGRDGVRTFRRPDVGDVALGGRPRDGRAGVLRDEDEARRPGGHLPGTHRVRHQQGRDRGSPADAGPVRLAGGRDVERAGAADEPAAGATGLVGRRAHHRLRRGADR
jgi:phosphoribosyl 1,2-cyclic phosphodiesterase